MLRSLASALFLTERDAEFDDNKPKVKGRIITTIRRPRKSARWWRSASPSPAKASRAEEAAGQVRAPTPTAAAMPGTSWRKSDVAQWNPAIAPVVAARRRCLQLLGDKQAVRVLFDEIAPRFADRPGGYTRMLRLAKPRLGDAGTRAILELVGVRDRVIERSVKPNVRRRKPAEPAAASS